MRATHSEQQDQCYMYQFYEPLILLTAVGCMLKHARQTRNIIVIIILCWLIFIRSETSEKCVKFSKDHRKRTLSNDQ